MNLKPAAGENFQIFDILERTPPCLGYIWKQGGVLSRNRSDLKFTTPKPTFLKVPAESLPTTKPTYKKNYLQQNLP